MSVLFGTSRPSATHVTGRVPLRGFLSCAARRREAGEQPEPVLARAVRLGGVRREGVHGVQRRRQPKCRGRDEAEGTVGDRPYHADMTRRDWEQRLPEGVRMQDRDKDSFTLGVTLPGGEDGLWLMRCPQHPTDHVFKIVVTQNEDADETSDLYCPYCGHHEDELWPFAPDQEARLQTAAQAAAEQYIAAELNNMLSKAFGGRSRSSSRRSGFSIEMTYKPGRPPPRRTLPTFEVEETRRTMQCGVCDERFAVYGLALYCPNCGQMAPAQQFAELIRVQQDRLAALDALSADHRQALADSGVLTTIYESTLKDGFSALETYLKGRFTTDAPTVSLNRKGAVFQRLDDAADLYHDHLGVDLPALVGFDSWTHLARVAALRHLLVHSAGIVDSKFLNRLPDWPQQVGQKVHINEHDAHRFLEVLADLAAAV